MKREQMIADLIECRLVDLGFEDLEDLARETLKARYAANYTDAQIFTEYAELIAQIDAEFIKMLAPDEED